MLKALQHKQTVYLELVKSAQDCHGFIQSEDCDSLLFTGLVGCVPGVAVDIDAAFDITTQQWQRRPVECPCWPAHSASTISRDMLTGLAFYAWRNKRLDISEQIIKFALSNWLMMGKATTLKDKLGRCLLTPGLLATWAEVSYRLGGPNRWWLRWIPQVQSKSTVGFQAHLSVLHCLLREELTGKLNTKIVEHHAHREPNNPLFQIAAKDYLTAARLLLDSRLWPDDALPTTLNRRDAWLPQRDYGPDWKPYTVGEVKQHSGGDFLFLYDLLIINSEDS